MRPAYWLCYKPGHRFLYMSTAEDAAARVRRRLNEWKKAHGRGATKALGGAVLGKFGEPMSAQWASGILKGKSELRLADLDSVAELLGVPPGDLVRRNGDHYMELIPSEMKFVGYLRQLPDTVRRHLMSAWDYFFRAQSELLSLQKDTVDRRTKAARAERDRLHQNTA